MTPTLDLAELLENDLVLQERFGRVEQVIHGSDEEERKADRASWWNGRDVVSPAVYGLRQVSNAV